MYLFLNFLAYINILWLFRGFRRHRNLRRYCLMVVAVIIVMTMVMIGIEIATYEPAAYNNPLPMPIMVVSTIGSMLTMAFFIGAPVRYCFCRTG